MNPNMSIYRRLNPRLLVQAGMGLGLLHWANICLIYISNTWLIKFKNKSMANQVSCNQVAGFGASILLSISNVICYTMLCMLEWMRKMKHRIGTSRTRGLRGSALTAYIHGGIP